MMTTKNFAEMLLDLFQSSFEEQETGPQSEQRLLACPYPSVVGSCQDKGIDGI
jgi:hypothetical protein